mgnify:CR=1 FL=1
MVLHQQLMMVITLVQKVLLLLHLQNKYRLQKLHHHNKLWYKSSYLV